MVQGRTFALTCLAALIGLTLACTGNPADSVSPSAGGGPRGTNAAADGSTLKVSAPVAVSPINGTKPAFGTELVITNSTLQFAPGAVPLQYRFEIYDSAGATRIYQSPLVPAGAGGTTSHSPSANLTVDQTYTWWARAEYQGAVGPWPKEKAKFIAAQSVGFIRNNEIYDPLINGTTVGTVYGPVTWLPGVGVRLDSEYSYIEYPLSQPLEGGEYSAFLSNISIISSTEDPKYRALTMRQGQAAMNDNPYRATFEKRGNGATAMRFITGDIRPGHFPDTGPSERIPLPYQAGTWYFWKITWGSNQLNWSIREDTVTGNLLYDLGKSYSGTYRPNPHMVYVGSPWQPGDRGEALSLEHMIVKQVWVSPNPRPGFANQ